MNNDQKPLSVQRDEIRRANALPSPFNANARFQSAKRVASERDQRMHAFYTQRENERRTRLGLPLLTEEEIKAAEDTGQQ